MAWLRCASHGLGAGMTDHPHDCPSCGSPAYVGLARVECSRPGCQWGPTEYTLPDGQKVPMAVMRGVALAIVRTAAISKLTEEAKKWGIEIENAEALVRQCLPDSLADAPPDDINLPAFPSGLIPLSKTYGLVRLKTGEMVGLTKEQAEQAERTFPKIPAEIGPHLLSCRCSKCAAFKKSLEEQEPATSQWCREWLAWHGITAGMEWNSVARTLPA